jgi:acetyl esterase
MALMRAGTSVELHLYPGTFHGSVHDTTAAVSRRMIADKIGSFSRILA